MDTPPTVEGSAKKRRAQQNGTYADAMDSFQESSSLRVSKEEITDEQLALLMTVSRAISGIRHGRIPGFLRTFLREGAAIVMSRDKAFLIWLSEQMENISP